MCIAAGMTILPLLTIGVLLLWSRKWFREPVLTGYRAVQEKLLFPLKCAVIDPLKRAWSLVSCKCCGDWEWRFQKPERQATVTVPAGASVKNDDESGAFHYAIYISFLCLPAVSSELARAFRCIPFDDGTRYESYIMCLCWN